MSQLFGIDELTSLMPPPAGAGEHVDWADVSEALGLSLPADYVRFMAVYGGGGIDDCLEIAVPDSVTPPGESPVGIAEETANAQYEWQTYGGLPDVDPEAQVIAWAVGSSGDMLCWLAGGGDPDRWPVVVWSRSKTTWAIYGCGMVEFLLRVFLEGFDECPIGDFALWGNNHPRFLHWREEIHLRESGIDPWTGEPDPFAGMFGP